MIIKKHLNYDTYLSMINKSVGSSMFRSVYVLDENENKIDILNDGDKSCAFYVSCILKIFDLIKSIHCTVNSTIKDMKETGWKNVNLDDFKPGDVLLWDKNIDTPNKHLGFYIGNELAVSNSSSLKFINVHHFTYNNRRKIIEILRWYNW